MENPNQSLLQLLLPKLQQRLGNFIKRKLSESVLPTAVPLQMQVALEQSTMLSRLLQQILTSQTAPQPLQTRPQFSRRSLPAQPLTISRSWASRVSQGKPSQQILLLVMSCSQHLWHRRHYSLGGFQNGIEASQQRSCHHLKPGRCLALEPTANTNSQPEIRAWPPKSPVPCRSCLLRLVNRSLRRA